MPNQVSETKAGLAGNGTEPPIQFHKGFQDVDSSRDSSALVKAMERASRFPDVIRYRERMTTLCPIEAGGHVLDVGCGLGQEIRRLARIVGKEGQAVGIDRSDTMISQAWDSCRTDPTPPELRVADVHDLPFGDNRFDVARAERTLMYVEDPARAISEMARVVNRGGHVATFEVDFKGLFIDSDYGDLARRVEDACITRVPNPMIGRDLPRLYRQAGLTIDHIELWLAKMPLVQASHAYGEPLDRAVQQGKISEQELREWWEEQTRMDRNGKSFIAHPGYIVVGSKP